MATQASIAMRVQDNLSSAIVGMKNSVTAFRSDVKSLQGELDRLNSARVSIRMDLEGAKQKAQEARKAFLALGESATEAERQAAKASWKEAEENLDNIRQQYELVGRQVRQTTRDMEQASGAISKADNRAGGGAGILSALGTAGLLSMAGDAAGQLANFVVGSALGSDAGSLFSGALNGATSGAALGSLLGAPGIAAGAALGGALGLVGGGIQQAERQDQAFVDYYTRLYDAQKAQRQEALASGSGTAAQRELDAIAFNRLLGDGIGNQYLSSLRTMAASTPMEYGDLTGMSRALATGFGDSPERMLELMTAIGDAGSAVGVTAADMREMARAMSRMNSSGKATLEFLNIFQDRGVDVIGMLGEAMGRTQGEVYAMISKGEIKGQEAANIIQEGMGSYQGAMAQMSKTFSGLSSTLSDTMTEIENGYGQGYNTLRGEGMSREIAVYGGLLGTAMTQVNQIAGENAAYRENLKEQYAQEAQAAVLLGRGTTLFSEGDQKRLAGMRGEYSSAMNRYAATGDRDAALELERLSDDIQTMAQAAYENSDAYKAVQEAEKESLSALRENTTAVEASTAAYSLSQERTKGGAAGRFERYFSGPPEEIYGTYLGKDQYVPGHAYGLRRVPYDNYAALLHQGERVLTAREARQADGAGGAPNISITVSGNTFGAGMDEEAVAQALADQVSLKLLAGYQG